MAVSLRTEMERRVTTIRRERLLAPPAPAPPKNSAPVERTHHREHPHASARDASRRSSISTDVFFSFLRSSRANAQGAYCLADCGRDAHQHVGTCPEGIASVKASKTTRRVGGYPPTVYGSKEAFEVSQKRRRCKHLALSAERHDAKTRDAPLEMEASRRNSISSFTKSPPRM